MLPSSPLAPFTPAILQHLPEPEPEPRSDQPVQPDQNPLSPLAPVAVGTQGKCCGDVDGGGGGFTGVFPTGDGGVANVANGIITSIEYL